MNTNTLRRPYAAPNAELICLAPASAIANTWTWNPESKNDKWGNNKWGVQFNLNAVSATGIAEWAVDELESD